MLFRITQEAMANTLKHAASHHIDLRLSFSQQALLLSIEDDGCGFNEESIREHPRRGIGLRNMRERIETIGGELTVYSKPGRTCITATLPTRAIKNFNTPD
jgi:two-component system, NarL family, sensor kinase